MGQLLFVTQQAAQALAIERLEPLGLSPRVWGVLSTLAESGPMSQIQLATTMSIDRTAMVYLLDEPQLRTKVHASAIIQPLGEDDQAALKELVEAHHRATGSVRAAEVLRTFGEPDAPHFVKIVARS